MKTRRMDHVGIVVDDLPTAKAFFLDLGFEDQGEGELEGEWLDEIAGLKGAKTALVWLGLPDGQTNIELIKFYSPPGKKVIQRTSTNTLGIRHITFAVEDIEAVLAKLKEKGMKIF